MFNFGKSRLLIASSLLVFSTSFAFAQEGKVVAGTKISSTKNKLNGNFEPKKNITNFLDTPQGPVSEETQDIHFSADSMENNKELETITAIGNVNIIRNNMTLIADKVIYNQRDDIITAVGNVVLVEKDGSVIFSDYTELTNQMNKGELNNLKIIMADKTRISAQKARKLGNNNKIMDNVTYTPCDSCKGQDPIWQIKARKVKHDATNQDVYYNDAFLELKGVPVFYTPFLSHPDPTVKRRSGFLAPSFGSTSYLGATLQPKYFWNISDNEDFTFSPMLSADRGIIWGSDYRKYFYRGDLTASATFMNDSDNDDKRDKEEVRGSLFLKSRYEIDDYWVSNLNINYVSDRTYPKDLSLPDKDDPWLTSSYSLQGFDNRNYAEIEAYYYKIISNNIKDYDKPYVLPLFNYENYGDVQKYGAYTKTNFSMASVYKEEETSSQRLSMINSWVLPYTSPYGEKYKMIASVKSDLYYVDNYVNPDDEEFSGSVARIFPQVGMEWRLPFVRATETSRQILEPVIVAVAAPNGGNKYDKIPNEDSRDMELDDTNILDLDRYAGYDRNDTGSRISYGINWSAYGDIVGRTSMFIAQSYKFDKDESFSEALNNNNNSNLTDYVGRVYAAPNEYLDLDYRFRMDKDNYDLNYSELGAQVGPSILKAYVSYIFLQKNNSSSLVDGSERKELYTSLTASIAKDWSVTLYNRQDLAENRIHGSLEHGGELIYEDECTKLITYLRRTNSTDPEADNDFEFGATFLLKTLGGAGSK